ncbi:glycosyltransferase family 39 protein [Streptomyces sp. NPDC056716]|uniref:glycosyltransferase family 39 protein n=1 Tax=unclassified Streptomyces TaxID=2593676 RepID=UPI0036C49C04
MNTIRRTRPSEKAAPIQPPPPDLFIAVGVPALPAAVMLALSVWGLDRGMWWDEITTYEAATREFGELWKLLHTVDAVHGLYYLLMHAVLPPGEGDAVLLRLPSVLGMTLAVAGTAAIGRRLAGARTGVLAGLVLALSPLASHYAQEGRSYALVTAAVVLASLLFLRAVEKPSAARWAGYAAAVILATGLHLFAVLILLPHGVCLAAARAPWRTARRWLMAALAVALCVLPFGLLARRQAGQVGRLDPTSVKSVGFLVHEFIGPGIAAGALISALVIVGIRGPAGIRVLALPWLVVPSAVLLTYSFFQPAFHPRYVLHSLPALALLAAAGIDTVARAAARRLPRRLNVRRGGRPVVGFGLVLIAALLVLHLPGQLTERTATSRNDDQTAAAELIGAFARSGDAVVFRPATKRGLTSVYRREFSLVSDVLQVTTPADAGNLSGQEAPAHDIRRLLLGHDRIWVLDRSGVTADTSAAWQVKEQVLRDEYRRTWMREVTGLRVSLYVRKNTNSP